MILLSILYVALGVGLTFLVVVEVIIPLMYGERIFPWYRTRQLKRRLSVAKEQHDRQEIEQELASIEAKISKRGKPRRKKS